MFETEGFLFCPNSPLFHFKDGETRQRLLLPWEVRSGFLCVPQTGASVPMLLLCSALEQARNTVWLLHVCLPKTRALITQSNDTTFGFALSIVLALIAFQHFDETKKDAVSLMGRSARGSCPALGKGGFFRACPGRLSIQHNGIFICFYQTAFPGVRLRMDKGIIANFSGAFIKFVMICMVCVMKCLARQRGFCVSQSERGIRRCRCLPSA